MTTAGTVDSTAALRCAVPATQLSAAFTPLAVPLMISANAQQFWVGPANFSYYADDGAAGGTAVARSSAVAFGRVPIVHSAPITRPP